MLAVEFTIDPRVYAEAQRINTRFPKIVDGAIYSSLVRAAKSGRQYVATALSRLTTIKRADLTTLHRLGGSNRRRSIVDVVLPIGRNNTAGVSISDKRIPLVYFRAKEKRSSLKPRKYRANATISVTYTIRRGARKTIKNQPGPYTQRGAVFIGRGRKGQAKSAAEASSGHVAVFQRHVGTKRLPIRQVYGPSMARVIQDDPALGSALRFDLSSTFNKRMRHELQYRLQRELFPESVRSVS